MFIQIILKQHHFHALNMSDIVEDTRKYWDNESNCAQSAACGILEHYNYNNCIDTVKRALIPFGGGIGMKSCCGGVTGALSALGIMLSHKELEKEDVTEAFKTFRALFNQENHAMNCCDILSDFIDEEGNMDKDNPERKETCWNCVVSAVEIAKEILDEL